MQVDAVYSSQQRAAFSGYTDDPIPDDCIGVYGGAGLPVLYRGGTSQNSDYSGFRNATLNGVPVTAQTLEEMAASFGDAGHDTNADLLQGRSMLQIDYAGVLRAPIGATAVSELKLGIILRKSGLRYNTNAQQDNPVLAQLLPDVMLDDWAEKQSLKRKENVVAARMIASPSVEIRTNVFTQEQPVNRVQGEFRTATPADKELLGRASVADVTDRESFFAWLGARGVPCQLWNAATREAAYEEFANYESKVECVREPKQKKKARRVAVDRHVHVIRVRICCSLLDRVLTWRLRTPSMTKADQTCNDDDDDDDEHSASTSSEEYRENGMSASKTHQSEPETTPQEGVKRKFLRAVASIAEGRDLRVQTFVTQRLPFDANGNIVVSSARAAVRAVASQLRSHLGFGALLELDEDSMRVVFRTQRHVSNSPLKPRSLIGMRTKAVVYYFEAYVPGLPDQMPSVGDWAYRWVSNDEAEDIPPQPEAFPKVVANFRVRTSSCYFMSAQVVRIIDSFIDLAKEQRMDVSEYAQSDNARRMDFDRGFQESRERQLALQPSGLNEEKRAYSLCALGVRELQHLHGRRRRSSTDARRHSVIALADSQKLSSMSPSNETNFGERNAVGAAISMLDSHMLELVVHLFGRTIDIERFYWTCVTRMPIRLRNNLIARIGWLNVLDAEHPETRFELDLRNADHWKLAHILTQLAAFEEGVNFCEATFCRSHLDPPIPGWSLPASWDIFGYTGNLARGIPRCGLLGVTYKAEPNDDNTPLRRRMKKLFTMLGVERPKEDPLVAACRVSASTLV